MFDDGATYQRVQASGALAPRRLARLYNVSENEIAVIPFDVALAIKITLPRPVVAGSPGDTDVYGAQQHAPLMDIEIAPSCRRNNHRHCSFLQPPSVYPIAVWRL